MKSSARRHLEFAALCLLTVAMIWWFGRKLNWVEVREAASHANLALLAVAVVIVTITYLVRSFRWGSLLAPLGSAGLRDLFIATTVGFGALFLLGRLGEVVRPVILPMRDPRVRPSASFVTIAIERVYDVMAVVIMFAANLLWFRPPFNTGQELTRVRLAGTGLLLAATLGLSFLIWFRRRSPGVIGWLKSRLEGSHFFPLRLTHVIVRMLAQLASALRVLVDIRELAVTIGWTAILWSLIAVANLLVLRAFGLKQFGISYTVFVLGWSLVGSLVPTPGGAAGAFHAVTAAGLVFLGVPRETAVAAAIGIWAVDFGPSVVLGLFYVLRGEISLSQLRSLVTPEAVEHAVEDESLLPDASLADRKLQSIAAVDGG